MEQGDIEPLLMLLRRFATEAAREEARMFCEELVDGVVLELRRPAGRLTPIQSRVLKQKCPALRRAFAVPSEWTS